MATETTSYGLITSESKIKKLKKLVRKILYNLNLYTFGNDLFFFKNLKFMLPHWVLIIRKGRFLTPVYREHQKRGYSVLGKIPPSVLNPIKEAIQRELDRDLAVSEILYQRSETREQVEILAKRDGNPVPPEGVYSIGIKGSIHNTQHFIETKLHEYKNIFTPELTKKIKECLGSEFRVFRVDAWRNLNRPHKDWWHFDNNPPHRQKMFVYLTDVEEKHGPFTILDRKNTIKVNKLRKDKNWLNTYNGGVDIDSYPIEKITGSAGTVFMANTHFCLHKQNRVTPGLYRDSIQFVLEPAEEMDLNSLHLEGAKKGLNLE